MQLINNKVKVAKYKLSQHRLQGERSALSVFQVATLMDMVRRGEVDEKNGAHSVFYSWN